MQLNDTTQAKVRNIIATWLDVDFDEVLPNKRIMADLCGDSLDCVEIIMAMEDEFDILLQEPLEDTDDPTVQELFDMLAKARN